ncbi:hypothetical protein Hanom_Chr03g00249741 [Helianthus anomalus]
MYVEVSSHQNTWAAHPCSMFYLGPKIPFCIPNAQPKTTQPKVGPDSCSNRTHTKGCVWFS